MTAQCTSTHDVTSMSHALHTRAVLILMNYLRNMVNPILIADIEGIHWILVKSTLFNVVVPSVNLLLIQTMLVLMIWLQILAYVRFCQFLFVSVGVLGLPTSTASGGRVPTGFPTLLVLVLYIKSFIPLDVSLGFPFNGQWPNVIKRKWIT